jgi:hypothetical protein
MAIVHPMTYETRLATETVIWLIAATWVAATILAATSWFWFIRSTNCPAGVIPLQYNLVDVCLYIAVSIGLIFIYSRILYISYVWTSDFQNCAAFEFVPNSPQVNEFSHLDAIRNAKLYVNESKISPGSRLTVMAPFSQCEWLIVARNPRLSSSSIRASCTSPGVNTSRSRLTSSSSILRRRPAPWTTSARRPHVTGEPRCPSISCQSPGRQRHQLGNSRRPSSRPDGPETRRG